MITKSLLALPVAGDVEGVVVAEVAEGTGPQAVRARTAMTASLDRKDAMLALDARTLGGRVGGEAIDELGPELRRRHDRVDDQVRRQAVEVDVLSVLFLQLRDIRRALGFRLLLDLVVEDGVDRRARSP